MSLPLELIEERLGSFHCKHKRHNLYIALEFEDEDFNFFWSLEEVENFDQWYKDGISIQEMAIRFNRDVDEVLILLIDRARKDKINHQRKKKSPPAYKLRMKEKEASRG